MFRFITVGLLALVGLVAGASPGQGQVFVRAPFVRVFVGPGVNVRAPFVNVPPSVMVEPTQPVEPLPLPQKSPQPNAAPDKAPSQAVTLGEFVKTFQPRGGNYDVLLINPLTKAATPVRSSLPDGMPRRVIADPQGVEFVYGVRHFVRIHFNSDGAVVTSR